MMHLIITILCVLFFADLYWGLSRRRRRMDFKFSRYNMFTIKPGVHNVMLSAEHYNLPKNMDVSADYLITKDGFLDEVRECKNVFIGGSTAFGIGGSGNQKCITGWLKSDHQIDVVNLATPGWNVEQEVITLFKHISTLKPDRVVFFHGANNFALALPYDYNDITISDDPLAFYQESKYAETVDQHFGSIKKIGKQYSVVFRETFRHSLAIRFLYNIFLSVTSKKPDIFDHGVPESDELLSCAIDNYLEWLKIFVNVASARGIDVHCVLQPYYAYGRDISETAEHNFYKVHKTFDECMVRAYDKLDTALSDFDGVIYHPLFKAFAKESVGLFTDAVHLNDQGYKLIAKKIKHIFQDG